MSAATKGVVDVAMLDARIAAETEEWSVPSGRAAWQLTGEGRQRAIVRDGRVRFDLDGVAKGWIADRALRLLDAYPGALVDAVREMAGLLEERGVNVRYAIHEVAGRMPGHMNVLLAEANVPYDRLFKREDIEADFKNTDVVLVIGANDVVNPAARHDAASPIYGMPILDVDNAQHIIVLKRSMNPGFAGIQNELFFDPKTSMLFGDAKKMMMDVASATKEL